MAMSRASFAPSNILSTLGQTGFLRSSAASRPSSTSRLRNDSIERTLEETWPDGGSRKPRSEVVDNAPRCREGLRILVGNVERKGVLRRDGIRRRRNLGVDARRLHDAAVMEDDQAPIDVPLLSRRAQPERRLTARPALGLPTPAPGGAYAS